MLIILFLLYFFNYSIPIHIILHLHLTNQISFFFLPWILLIFYLFWIFFNSKIPTHYQNRILHHPNHHLHHNPRVINPIILLFPMVYHKHHYHLILTNHPHLPRFISLDLLVYDFMYCTLNLFLHFIFIVHLNHSNYHHLLI